jgi:hypothetical protein
MQMSFGRFHKILLLAVEYVRARKKNITCKELVTNGAFVIYCNIVGSELTLPTPTQGWPNQVEIELMVLQFPHVTWRS